MTNTLSTEPTTPLDVLMTDKMIRRARRAVTLQRNMRTMIVISNIEYQLGTSNNIVLLFVILFIPIDKYDNYYNIHDVIYKVRPAAARDFDFYSFVII